MKVTINKNEIASALIALGKNICRTSPAILHKSLHINTIDGEIKLATCKGDEEVTFTTAAETVGTLNVVVLFDEFKEALKSCRAKTVEIACEHGIFIYSKNLANFFSDKKEKIRMRHFDTLSLCP